MKIDNTSDQLQVIKRRSIQTQVRRDYKVRSNLKAYIIGMFKGNQA
jgi:hypothetical protein